MEQKTLIEEEPALVHIKPPTIPSVPSRRATHLAHPPLTKSGVRALGCPVYYTGEYLQPVSGSQHFLLVTGNEFHEWRRAYVDHLIETQQSQDPAFREQYLATHALSQDARALIARDDFSVNFTEVWGTEVYLSVDSNYELLERFSGGEHRLFSEKENAYLHGVLDLLLLSEENTVATINDYKSGFSTTGIHDAEPQIYAALVFAAFKTVQRVNWLWDFSRLGLGKRANYTRADLKWIHPMIDNQMRLASAAVDAYNQQQPLLPNPLAGLCPYCNLSCPMRPRWEAGELAIGPVQTEEDAVRMARLKLVCQTVLQRADTALRPWMDQNPEIDLGYGWEATLQTTEKRRLPLRQVLHQLGVGLVDITDDTVREVVEQAEPRVTPRYDVPLDSLTLGGTSGFARTKKRVGLSDELREIGKSHATCSTRILIRKAEVSKLLEELTGTNEDECDE